MRKKIYKLVVSYGFWSDSDKQYRRIENWEFYNTRKAAFQHIDYKEQGGELRKYYQPSAKVYEMECDLYGRFYEKSEPITDFMFSHD